MKTIYIILGVLVIAVAGYFVYMRYSPATTQAPADTASSGKLDINAVCESALAYMTFSDAASAEVFVAECKEGKHPEVIERYKQEHGYGEGAAI